MFLNTNFSLTVAGSCRRWVSHTNEVFKAIAITRSFQGPGLAQEMASVPRPVQSDPIRMTFFNCFKGMAWACGQKNQQ